MKLTDSFSALLTVILGSAVAISSSAESEMSVVPLDPASDQTQALAAPARIWQGEVGDGFQSTVQTFSIETAVVLGVQAFGGQQVHDLALLSLSYGHMLGNVVGGDHWYRGNWEGRLELFGGGQFSPVADPLVGLTPHIRYDFATGSRWVPFFDLGGGVTASGELQTRAGLLSLTSRRISAHISFCEITLPSPARLVTSTFLAPVSTLRISGSIRLKARLA